MTAPPSPDVRIAPLVCLALLVATVAAAAPAVSAAPPDPDGYVAEQDGHCVALDALGDGTTNVSDFYDYRVNPNFSSHGTTHLQERQLSQLFVYDGADGHSLVLLHDRMEVDDHGGAITMEFEGLPENGSWVVEDDYYGEETDDNFVQEGDRNWVVDWMWGPNRTDGGAFGGLDGLANDSEILIDAGFGEDSAVDDKLSWPWVGDPIDWFVRYGAGDDELAPLDRSESLTVRRGSCADTPPVASLSASSSTVGVNDSVTLDASRSYDEADVEDYVWDVDGDGTTDANGSDPTVEVAYETRRTVEPSVTVVDENGSTATATTTVTVEDRTPPAVRATANRTTVGVGEAVRLNGSNSTDEFGIDGYDWTIGTEANASGPVTTHRFDAPGTHEVVLSVTDEAGNENETAIAVTVQDETDPTARIDAPATAMANESVTFDGSASTDDVGVETHEWDFDDGGGATGTTANHSFATAGTYNVTLTVVDGAGNANETTSTVDVAPVNDSDGGDGDDGDDGDGDDGDDGDGDGDDGDGDGDDGDGDNSDDGGDGDNSDDGGDGDNSDDGGDGDNSDDGGDGGSDAGDGDSGSGGSSGGGSARPIELAVEEVEVADEEIEPGETANVSVTLRNVAERSGVRELELVDGLTVLDDATVALTANETERVGFEGSLEEVGTYEFTLDEMDVTTVRVVDSADADDEDDESGGGDEGATAGPAVELTDVSVLEDEIAAGDSVVVTATFENAGERDATTRANVTVMGDRVTVEEVQVPAGGSETIRIERAIEEAGTHTVTVEGQGATVDVAPADGSDQSTGAASEPENAEAPTGGVPTAWLLTGIAGALGLLAIVGRYS